MILKAPENLELYLDWIIGWELLGRASWLLVVYEDGLSNGYVQ